MESWLVVVVCELRSAASTGGARQPEKLRISILENLTFGLRCHRSFRSWRHHASFPRMPFSPSYHRRCPSSIPLASWLKSDSVLDGKPPLVDGTSCAGQPDRVGGDSGARAPRARARRAPRVACPSGGKRPQAAGATGAAHVRAGLGWPGWVTRPLRAMQVPTSS